MEDNATLDFEDPALMDPESPEYQAFIDKAFGGLAAEDVTGGEGEEHADPTAKQDEPSAPSGAAAGEGDQNPQGVLAADGKHVIPYDVLKQSRQAEAQAREAAQRALEELEALKAQIARGAAGGEVEVDVETSNDVDKALAVLVEDYPELAGYAKGVATELSELRGVVQTLIAERAQVAAQDTANRRLSVREAIDNNPELSLWEREDPAAWERAKELDTYLKARPDWQGKPVQDRFAHVVKLVRADYPSAKSSTVQKPPAGGSLEDKVKAALESAGDIEIGSLSHLPGGVAPAANEIATLSAYQLGAVFEQMTPEQMDAYIAKYG